MEKEFVGYLQIAQTLRFFADDAGLQFEKWFRLSNEVGRHSASPHVSMHDSVSVTTSLLPDFASELSTRLHLTLGCVNVV